MERGAKFDAVVLVGDVLITTALFWRARTDAAAGLLALAYGDV